MRINKIIVAFSLVVASFALVSCGGATSESNPSSGGSSGGTDGGSGSTSNLSNIGVDPTFSTDHAGYMTGSHANFGCGDSCHALTLTNRTVDGEQASVLAETDRTKICANCHQGAYAATSKLPHAQHGIGTYCNSCHYSDSFTSRNRAPASSYHNYITTSCESCHAGRQPASHNSSGRTSNCASCHSYPNWASATGFSHVGVTSGCNASGCHSKHYSGYDCVWCHTGSNPGVSYGSWSHSRADDRACTACHADGKGDDDGKDDDDDDDDDDDGKGDDRVSTVLSWLE